MITHTHCFYAPGATSIQDIAVQRNGEWFGGYSGDTEEAMKARTGAVLTLWDDALVALEAAQRAVFVTAPKRITEADFWRALEVLPPCRWTNGSQTETFHVSERITTGDLVDWYVRRGSTYYHLVESASLSHEQIMAKVTT